MPTVIDSVSTALEPQLCPECGVAFAIPTRVGEDRREKGGSFYCPNGHSLTYGQTELKRLRSELEKQKLETIEQRNNFFAEQRKHEQTTKELKRTKKRVANGVCPCCHRTVSQLSRHMKTKHPEFIAETKTS